MLEHSRKMRSPMRVRRMIVIAFVLDLLLVGLLILCKSDNLILTSTAFAEEKMVALTFDDGPHPRYTEQLLDGLKERGVVATFFVTGQNANRNPDIIERMQKEGHLIGNHTYTHIQLTSINEEIYKKEILDTNKVISDITGCETSFIRPPYGSWKKKIEIELNMVPVLWTVDTKDWCSTDVSAIVRRGTKKTKENDIILMHDYYNTSVKSALKIVDILKDEGFTFVTVDELLFD